MRIGDQEYSEIIIAKEDGEFLASISDEDIVGEIGIEVMCVPLED